mgnify:CR=1 FL=1
MNQLTHWNPLRSLLSLTLPKRGNGGNHRVKVA